MAEAKQPPPRGQRHTYTRRTLHPRRSVKSSQTAERTSSWLERRRPDAAIQRGRTAARSRERAIVAGLFQSYRGRAPLGPRECLRARGQHAMDNQPVEMRQTAIDEVHPSEQTYRRQERRQRQVGAGRSQMPGKARGKGPGARSSKWDVLRWSRRDPGMAWRLFLLRLTACGGLFQPHVETQRPQHSAGLLREVMVPRR